MKLCYLGNVSTIFIVKTIAIAIHFVLRVLFLFFFKFESCKSPNSVIVCWLRKVLWIHLVYNEKNGKIKSITFEVTEMRAIYNWSCRRIEIEFHFCGWVNGQNSRMFTIPSLDWYFFYWIIVFIFMPLDGLLEKSMKKRASELFWACFMSFFFYAFE